MTIGNVVNNMLAKYTTEGTEIPSLYSNLVNYVSDFTRKLYESSETDTNTTTKTTVGINDNYPDTKKEKDIKVVKKVKEANLKKTPKGIYNISSVSDGANTYSRLSGKSGYEKYRDSVIIDNQWIKNVFILPLRDIYSSEKMGYNPKNRYLSPVIYYTNSSEKMYNTAVGNYKVLNPKYQFTEYCDIRHSATSMYPFQNVTVNDKSIVRHYPLGRYYSEAIDDTINILYLSFGLPKYNTIFGFLQNTISPLDAYILKTGNVPGKIFESLLKIIRMMGYTVFVGRVLLPHMLIGAVLLGITIGSGLLVTRKRTYYYMKPRMDFYLSMVKHIVSEFMIHLGMVDDSTLPISVQGSNKLNTKKQNYLLNPGLVEQLNAIIPGFVDITTGNINITRYISSYYCRKVAFQQKYVELETKLNKDLSKYIKSSENENDDRAYFMDWVKSDFDEVMSGGNILDIITRGNLKASMDWAFANGQKDGTIKPGGNIRITNKLVENFKFTYGEKNIEINYDIINDLVTYILNYYRSIVMLNNLKNPDGKRNLVIDAANKFTANLDYLGKYAAVVIAAIIPRKIEISGQDVINGETKGKAIVKEVPLTLEEAKIILLDIDSLVYDFVLESNNVLNKFNLTGTGDAALNAESSMIDDYHITTEKERDDALAKAELIIDPQKRMEAINKITDSWVLSGSVAGRMNITFEKPEQPVDTSKMNEDQLNAHNAAKLENDTKLNNEVLSNTEAIVSTYGTGSIGTGEIASNANIAERIASGKAEPGETAIIGGVEYKIKDVTGVMQTSTGAAIQGAGEVFNFIQEMGAKKSPQEEVDMKVGFQGGANYIAFQTNYVGVQSVNINNSVNSVETESILNSGSSFFRKIYQNGLGTLAETMNLNNALWQAVTIAGTAVEGLTMGISNIFMGIIMGGKYRMPKVWADSDSEFGHGHQFKLELRSPYGDPVSQLINLYIPLAMILAGSLPISIGNVAYTSPLLCSAFQKGVCNIELGMITNVEIERNVGNMGMDGNRRPLGIDVHITITDLDTHGAASTNIQNIFNLPMSQIIGRDFSTKISRYIQSMAGTSIYDTTNAYTLFRKSIKYYTMYRDGNILGTSGDANGSNLGIGRVAGDITIPGTSYTIRDFSNIISGGRDDIFYGGTE